MNLNDASIVLSAHEKVLAELMSIPGVTGAHIVSLLGDTYDYYETITTHTKNMPNHLSVKEFKSRAETFCSASCCAEEPFSADSCAECSLYEFLKIIEEEMA